jgi:hypothetical protein
MLRNPLCMMTFRDRSIAAKMLAAHSIDGICGLKWGQLFRMMDARSPSSV